MAASLTDHAFPFNQPVCQNCQTSTTPLWRRDEQGSVLCNACGLFLKLHGRARPISLKTDVIKSRNRVKSANQGPKKKVSVLKYSTCATVLTSYSSLNPTDFQLRMPTTQTRRMAPVHTGVSLRWLRPGHQIDRTPQSLALTHQACITTRT